MEYTLGSTLLYAENVSVKYDDKVIIKDINMIEKDVNKIGQITGQTVAVVGRSGRGKSTLFKVLTGLVKPCTGKILVPEHPGSDIAKIVEEGDVGFVNQKYTLFRNKTVRETLAYALRNSKYDEKDKKIKIEVDAYDWGLLEHIDKYPGQLSGGQRQRVAILEQMFCSENFIIMDEPFSGLDVGNIEKVKSSFDTICSTHDFNTIVFSTHDIDLAVALADSVYVLGFPTIENEIQNYGTIVKHYDLKAMGLAWNKEMSVNHYELSKEIKNELLKS